MSRNMLDQETSPYLLQHKDNPVHWYAWGAEAFQDARKYGKPVLLSVGYAACHWCHVMAHESFEDPRSGRADERAVRQYQGGSRRAPRRGRDLHAFAGAARAAGRLAADHVSDIGRRTVLGRHLFSTPAPRMDGPRFAMSCAKSIRSICPNREKSPITGTR